MKSEQISINFTGNQLKEIGIATAVDHAEQDCPGWNARALEFLLQYPGEEFQAEDVRAWAHSQGLPRPPHARAWGGVIVKARKQGKIQFVGYQNVKNPRAHSTPASVWKKIECSEGR